MKKLALLTVLAVGAANADIIPNLETVVNCGPGCTTYNYSVTLNENTVLTAASDGADYFTIYDFGGYIVGSIMAPLGWTASAQASGTTPAPINAVDGPLTNLTFTYTGASDVTSSANPITGFSANSRSSSFLTGVYSSFAHKAPTSDVPGGNDYGYGEVLVPAPGPGDDTGVPEPMSMMLLGGGLGALGLLPRRFKKN